MCASIIEVLSPRCSATRPPSRPSSTLQAKKAVYSVIGGIVDAAKRGDKINLAGFGKFKVKDSRTRQGRNPSTGASIKIAASRKLGFSAPKQVTDALAG